MKLDSIGKADSSEQNLGLSSFHIHLNHTTIWSILEDYMEELTTTILDRRVGNKNIILVQDFNVI